MTGGGLSTGLVFEPMVNMVIVALLLAIMILLYRAWKAGKVYARSGVLAVLCLMGCLALAGAALFSARGSVGVYLTDHSALNLIVLVGVIALEAVLFLASFINLVRFTGGLLRAAREAKFTWLETLYRWP